jgi:hypothetical protein
MQQVKVGRCVHKLYLPVHNVLVAAYSRHQSGSEPGHVVRRVELSGRKHHAGVRIDGQGERVVEVHVVKPPRVRLQQ